MCVCARVCVCVCVGGGGGACVRACVSNLSAYDHLAGITIVYSVLLMHFPLNTDLRYWCTSSTFLWVGN